MTRLLAIPVAGTVAALLAILWFHRVRDVHEDAGPALRQPPPFEVPAPDDVEEEPEDEAGDETPPPPPPPPRPRTFRLQLRADGALEDLESGETYEDAAAALVALAPDPRVRHTVMLGNATPEVPEAAVDAVVEALAKRCDVKKVYRGPANDGG